MVDFLVIGYINSISYNNIHPLVINGKFSFGYNKVISYKGEISAQGEWFSNISDYCPPPLVLKKDYRLDDYKRFDERPDIINIDKKEDIPDNYYGLMGVPVSVLMHINRNQFELLGVAHCGVQKYDLFIPYIDGEFKFSRWIIRRRKDG